MSFKDDNPNWRQYTNTKKYMTEVPQEAYSELSGLIRKSARDSNELKNILNGFSEIIPCEPTGNWGWSFLEQDISIFISAIKSKVNKGRFPVFMDCLALLHDNGDLTLEQINEYLEDNSIGYTADTDFNHNIIWLPVEESTVLRQLDEAQTILPSVSKQACDEIRRAMKSLEDKNDERAIKDALRSCVSAMEAVIKELGNEKEIGNATKKLKDNKLWGKPLIVKEGISIFNTIHELYPDLRHGSTETSQLSLNEAEYWIGRILNYVMYMEKQQRLIGREKE